MNLTALCHIETPPEWYGTILGRVLHALIREGINGDVLELGIGSGDTHVGLHQTVLAASGGDPKVVIGVDNLARPDIFKIDINHLVKRIYDLGSTPHILLMDSREAIQYLAHRQLSFLFVDAGHDYEDARRDLSFYIPLVVSNGVVAVHDVEQPGVAKALREVESRFLETVFWAAPDPTFRMMWTGVKL